MVKAAVEKQDSPHVPGLFHQSLTHSIPFLTQFPWDQPISEGVKLLGEGMAGQFCIPQKRWGHDNRLPALIPIFETHKRPTHKIALV